MNIAPVRLHPEKPHDYDLYRRINAASIKRSCPIRSTNRRWWPTVTWSAEGNPAAACYWLLMTRLAELALLCAGYYADCGGHRGGDCFSIPMDRRSRPGNASAHRQRPPSTALRAAKRRRGHPIANSLAGSTIMPSPASWNRLLFRIAGRLTHSGWIQRPSGRLSGRMAQVPMPCGSVGAAGLSAPPGQPAFRRVDRLTVFFDRPIIAALRQPAIAVWQDIEQTWHDAAYRSPYLVAAWHSEIPTAAAGEKKLPGLPEQLPV